MALNPAEKKEVALFQKFMEGRKILIADGSSSSRSGLFIILRDLGIKPAQLVLVNNYTQAEDYIVKEKPHIVISEYDLGKKCGVELFLSQRQQRPKETKECLFIIVTGNTSQSAVARSAEEDIDAYILKPFTPQMVRKALLKAAVMKLKPPDYLVKIDEGKALMESGNLDEAEKKFNEALPMDAAPALAQYYLGQVSTLRKILDGAKGKYAKGLEYNKIHYKCMLGLYETLMSMNKPAEAYEVVKKISQYFPANPKRLSEVLRLAIVNGKYEDIEKYYSIFINIEDRHDTLIKYICAALVVCGKYYLSTNVGRSRALELFQKAAATGTGRANIIREIISILIEFNLHKEAKKFIDRYPLDQQKTPDYLVLKFLILNGEGNPSATIAQGRELLAQGLTDERLFKVMITRSLESKLDTAAETLYYNAIKEHPAKQAEFEKLLGRSMKSA